MKIFFKNIIIPLMILFVHIKIIAQDLEVYNGRYYSGTKYNLNLGQTLNLTTTGDALSFKVNNPNVAIKVKRNGVYHGSNAIYPEISFYSEMSISSIDGTDQWDATQIIVSCIPRNLPQPTVFMPIDANNTNPAGRQHVKPISGHRVLMLRKAYLWENSEDLGGPDGPYGQIKINVCKTNVLNYSWEQLINDQSLWEPHSPYRGNLLYGPIYNNSAVFQPDPSNEWIDNWWGMYYSHIAIWDWDANSTINSIALIISEGDKGLLNDNNDDVLGRALIDKNMEGYILIKCRNLGWVIVENVDYESSLEQDVDVAGDYIYNGWSGNIPEDMEGPDDDRKGSQYRPFKSFSEAESGSQSTIGIMGNGIIPAGTHLTAEKTYRAAAPLNKPIAYTLDWYNYSAQLLDLKTNDTTNIITDTPDIPPQISDLKTSNIKNYSFFIYPNPASDNIIFRYELKEIQKISLSILDIKGSKISTLIDNIQVQGKYEVKWDINNLSQGIYFAVFKSGNSVYSYKWIKQ